MTPTVQQARLTLNFTSGRSGRKVDQITDHVSEGNRSSVVSWFNDPQAEVSSHYLVCVDGVILQFVDEADTAWHNGRVFAPTAPLVVARKGVNPNLYSIGIEHEGDGTKDLTPAQREATMWLHQDICKRYQIPYDRTHIVGHHEVYAKKTCPGKIDVDRIVKDLQATVMPEPIPAQAMPQVVWSNFFKGWLIPIKVQSDTDWQFVIYSELVKGKFNPQRGQTPLSQMPLHP